MHQKLHQLKGSAKPIQPLKFDIETPEIDEVDPSAGTDLDEDDWQSNNSSLVLAIATAAAGCW